MSDMLDTADEKEVSNTFSKLGSKSRQIAGGQGGTGMLDMTLNDAQNKQAIQDDLGVFAQKCNYPLGNQFADGNKIASGVAWGALQNAIRAAEAEGADNVVRMIETELKGPFVQTFQDAYGHHPRQNSANQYASDA